MKKTEGYRIRKLEDEYVVLPFGKRAEEVNEVISLSETCIFMQKKLTQQRNLQNWSAKHMRWKNL